MKKMIVLMIALYMVSLFTVPGLAVEERSMDDDMNNEIKKNTVTDKRTIKARAAEAAKANDVTREEARDRVKNARIANTAGDSDARRKRVEELRRKAKARKAEALEKARTTRSRVAKMSAEEIKELRAKRTAELRKRKEIEIKRREISREMKLKAREIRREARQKYKEARDEYRQRKSDFEQKRAELRECEDNCSDIEREVFESAREHLLNAIDRMIGKLRDVKARIESSDAVTDDMARDAINQLGRIISRLEELASEAEAAETKEELQNVAQEVRKAWQASHTKVKKSAYMAVGRKVGLIVKRAELLEKKLACAVENTDGSNPEVDALVEEFRSLVSSARDEFESARQSWDGSKETLEEAKESIRAGHDYLKEAHGVLKEVVELLRENGASFEDCSTDSGEDNDVEDVEEDESDEMDDVDEVESKSESEISIEVEGSLDLSDEARSTLDMLVATFEGTVGEFELNFKVEKHGNETRSDADVEGNLTMAQQEIWSSFQEQLRALVDSSEDGAELEIGIKHEFEIDESEDEVEEEESDEMDDDANSTDSNSTQ